MAKLIEKVACRTPAEGRDGVTKIPKWKFDAVRDAILAALRGGDLAFSELSGAVRTHLSEEHFHRLGSLGWHVTTVKLEMEVRGEIVRLDGSGPQRIKVAE